MCQMNRRELLATGLASVLPVPVVAAAEEMATDPVKVMGLQLLKLDIPTDDSRGITNTTELVESCVGLLESVPITMGWIDQKGGAPEVGRIVRWFVRDGWLCADAEICADVAVQIARKEMFVAPMLYSDAPRFGTATLISKAGPAAVVPVSDALWNEYRT